MVIEDSWDNLMCRGFPRLQNANVHCSKPDLNHRFENKLKTLVLRMPNYRWKELIADGQYETHFKIE